MDDEEEYKKQLGIIGVQMMNLGKQQAVMVEETKRELRSLSGIGEIGVLDTRITEIDDECFDSLVDRLRSSTFRVRIVNALGSIVEPLYDRLRIIQGENSEMNFKYHHEDALYYDKMLDAMFNMESKNSSQNRGIYLATKEFMRHPMWNSLRLTLKGLWEATKFSTSVLFGFGKKKSDTDRIVDAIKEQTQWHMTKSIKQEKGLLSKISSRGILGFAIRDIADTLTETMGIGQGDAQRNENIRSLGGDVSGLKNFVADFLYSGTITKKGRLGTIEQQNPTQPLLLEGNKLIDDLLKVSMLNKQANEAQLEFMYSHARIRESASRVQIEHQKNHEEELIELVRDVETGVYQTAKNSKETQKEVKKHRQQAFWMGFMNLGAKMVSGILSVGAKIAGMALSLLPMKGIAGLLTKLGAVIVGGIAPKIATLAAILMSKGGSLISTADRKTKGVRSKGGALVKAGIDKLSKMPTLAKGVGVGALVGLGGGLVANHLGRDTKAGAGADVLGQTAGYASTGALIGSMVPVLGTAIGAGIGGAIGLGKGLWGNRETLFGSAPKQEEYTITEERGIGSMLRRKFGKPDAISDLNELIGPPKPEHTITEEQGIASMFRRMFGKPDTITDLNALIEPQAQQNTNTHLTEAGKDILSEINEKTEKSNKIFEEEKRLSTEMVTLLKGILANTKQEFGETTSPLAGTGSLLLKNYGVK